MRHLIKNILTEFDEKEFENIFLKKREETDHYNIKWRIDNVERNSKKTLNLPDKGIREFPIRICSLTNLTKLELMGNHIEHIPECIGDLQYLSDLELYHNNLNQVPKTILNLKNLKYLGIGRNNISELPEYIANLENLIKLDISYNNIKTLPDVVGLLPNLRTLRISDNPLKPRLDKTFINIRKRRLYQKVGDKFFNFDLFKLDRGFPQTTKRWFKQPLKGTVKLIDMAPNAGNYWDELMNLYQSKNEDSVRLFWEMVKNISKY